MKLQNILISLMGLTLICCVTRPVKVAPTAAEVSKTNYEIEFSDARMPAGETIVNDMALTDKKLSQTIDGLAFSASTLAALQGTWSSKCTKAYSKAKPLWFLETLKFESDSYTKSIIQFADSACKKPLQQVINSKVKVELTVSTASGFRITNNWDEALQTVSSPKISTKACTLETVFPGCTESPYASARKAPWLIAALSGTDELFTDPHNTEFTNCDKPALVDGEKWCLLLKKTVTP